MFDKLIQCAQFSKPATAPAWSPNSSRIAFGCGADIYTVSADGSDLTNLTEDRETISSDFNPAWSPDSGRIAFMRDTDYCPTCSDPPDLQIGGLYIVSAQGNHLDNLVKVNP